MPRYFLELAYKGTAYHGFQIQDNAATIQLAIEKALFTLFKVDIDLTGSSRTDAGVHALQNYFHFDTDLVITNKHVYNLNAILPEDIAVKSIKLVADTAHCRFDAVARSYYYYIYQQKNPFLKDRGWFYPYELDISLLQQAAAILKNHTDFTSFAKRNTQVFTHNCTILISEWSIPADQQYIYHVQANRFLRGMVRGLVGTMLKVGRGQLSLDDFEKIILAKDCTKADFSTPPQGLFLAKVIYP
ncbi:tRNA pseudouridine(38-40) synthase TruA [Sediminibacterium sp.]|uniref:tRNA pseudouridine(38-40) synthase TruA n=1 Tax=Sediminibacterium sp. TaxID=1917865 RepID=UPI0025F185E9|nr:tRNA pseudouridine(38-40) synthase TruA [Sediminibacterium sp.]MBT9483915.1 tRNA pseudouridine(38-40) synthase TruA [Sediminibacterium sp.]